MGFKTWLTLKRPLPNRLNIVLSRGAEIEPHESVLVMRDVDSVLEKAKELPGDLFVIGGAQVYRSFLPHLDKWIVTEVPLTVEGADTFVPEDYLEGFMPTEEKDLGEHLRVVFYDTAPDSETNLVKLTGVVVTAGTVRSGSDRAFESGIKVWTGGGSAECGRYRSRTVPTGSDS